MTGPTVPGPTVPGPTVPGPTVPGPAVPGAVRSPERDVVLSPGRPRRRIVVVSRSARPIRVSSHYPFWRVNARLEFDRAAAAGYRLDIPAGASVRWAPGQSREVSLVALGGLMARDGRAGETGS